MTVTKLLASKCTQGLALAFALLLLPLGGNLSAQESGKKDKKWEESKKKKDHDLKVIWKKLQAAVKAGKMTQEDAKKKMALIKKKWMDSKKKGLHLKELWKKLQAAVKAGKMTEEEAKKKMAEAKKKAGEKKPAKKKPLKKKSSN